MKTKKEIYNKMIMLIERLNNRDYKTYSDRKNLLNIIGYLSWIIEVDKKEINKLIKL